MKRSTGLGSRDGATGHPKASPLPGVFSQRQANQMSGDGTLGSGFLKAPTCEQDVWDVGR